MPVVGPRYNSGEARTKSNARPGYSAVHSVRSSQAPIPGTEVSCRAAGMRDGQRGTLKVVNIALRHCTLSRGVIRSPLEKLRCAPFLLNFHTIRSRRICKGVVERFRALGDLRKNWFVGQPKLSCQFMRTFAGPNLVRIRDLSVESRGCAVSSGIIAP